MEALGPRDSSGRLHRTIRRRLPVEPDGRPEPNESRTVWARHGRARVLHRVFRAPVSHFAGRADDSQMQAVLQKAQGGAAQVLSSRALVSARPHVQASVEGCRRVRKISFASVLAGTALRLDAVVEDLAGVLGQLAPEDLRRVLPPILVFGASVPVLPLFVVGSILDRKGTPASRDFRRRARAPSDPRSAGPLEVACDRTRRRTGDADGAEEAGHLPTAPVLPPLVLVGTLCPDEHELGPVSRVLDCGADEPCGEPTRMRLDPLPESDGRPRSNFGAGAWFRISRIVRGKFGRLRLESRWRPFSSP